MRGCQQSILGGFTWCKGFWLAALFDLIVSFEGVLQVIVNQQAHIHGVLVFNLSNQVHQLGLH